MPSGSHRGSRGSHSSGGSRSSSSSRGGSHRSSFSSSSRGSSYGGHHGGYSRTYHHHHHPFRVRWGRRYYVYSDGVTASIALLIMGIFLSFVFILITSSNVNFYKNEIDYIKEDYYYYQDMIEYAEANRDRGYVVEGEVIDKFYNEEADRYYITYKVDIPNTNNDLEGYSYSCYTLEEAKNFRRGDAIEIALDSVPVSLETDSINVDYKNTTLDDDGEYLIVKSSLSKARWKKAASIGVFIGLIALMIFIIIKKMKPETSTEKKEEVKVESTTSVCAYCGATYSKSATRCPSCGAALRK